VNVEKSLHAPSKGFIRASLAIVADAPARAKVFISQGALGRQQDSYSAQPIGFRPHSLLPAL
jgi:hypothetical protein